MNLNFSTVDNKNKARESLSKDFINERNPLKREDAFLMLIDGLPKEEISNLCDLVGKKLNISSDMAYEIIKISRYEKELILSCAYEVLSSGKNLGTKTISDGKINTSNWIGHSLYAAKVCSELAKILNLDSEFAFCYGLLHDYGRKFSHDFDHTIIGFEALIDTGLKDFAKGCLTHSFLMGKRYGNNEPIFSGYSVDNYGNEIISEENKDDMLDVLKNSVYTPYDNILNIADLMATSYGILSPNERIIDIAKRRENVDSSLNRSFFFTLFYNLLLDILNKMGVKIDTKPIDFNTMDLQQIKQKFYIISDLFFNVYKKTSNELNRGNNEYK